MKHLVTTMKPVAYDHRGQQGIADILFLHSMREEPDGGLIGLLFEAHYTGQTSNGVVAPKHAKWEGDAGPTFCIGATNIAATQRLDDAI